VVGTYHYKEYIKIMAGTAVVSSPSVVTTSAMQGSDAAIMNALIAGMTPEQQQAVAGQLAIRAKKMANRRYITEAVEKRAFALTNGQASQAYALGGQFTFNLPQPNNSYSRGVVIRYVVNYTLAVGTAAVYGETAAGRLAFLDTIEVRYNKSQVKLWLWNIRQLAQAGAIDYLAIPDSVIFQKTSDPIEQAFVNSTLALSTGANTYTGEVFLPFNILSTAEDRGLLPTMPGETGVQVIINTPPALMNATTPTLSDPRAHVFYAVSGTGHAVSAVSGTLAIESVYLDGDTYQGPNKLPYDMSVLNGTIQMQIDAPLNNLLAGTIMRGKLNIMGQHQYVFLTIIDGVQPNLMATDNNIQYLESSQDDVGANVFWKYGLQTNMSFNEFLAWKRRIHQGDMDPGSIAMIEGPINADLAWGSRDGTQWLDNTKNGWPAWRYGFQLGAINAATIVPRVEVFTVFVNPVGLQPV